MWTMATCYAFAPRLGALFPMGFGWVPWGFLPCCCVERVTLRLPKKENRCGCLYWKDERSFPSWVWSSLKFKVSNHHIPKKRWKQSRSNIMWWELLCFLGIVWTLLCCTSTFGGGQCFFRGRKRCSRSHQLLIQCFFSKFSAAKYVTQTPFFDAMYMKSLCATSFPALAERADSKHLVDTHPNQSAIPVVRWAKGAWMNHSFVQLNFQQESVGSWWLKQRWLIFGGSSITSTFACATIIINYIKVLLLL